MNHGQKATEKARLGYGERLGLSLGFIALTAMYLFTDAPRTWLVVLICVFIAASAVNAVYCAIGLYRQRS